MSVFEGEVRKPAREENTGGKRLAQATDSLQMKKSIRRFWPLRRCGEERQSGSGEQNEQSEPVSTFESNQKGMAHSGTVVIGSVCHA